MLGMKTHFDISGSIEIREVDIAGVACNSKVSSLIRPKIKLLRAFMPVLVISNFDDDSIKNERASMETAFPL